MSNTTIPQSGGPKPASYIFLARLPTSGEELVGRENELDLLDAAWNEEHSNIFTLAASGGVGKTSLVNHWLKCMKRDNYRDATRVFGWSFYSQGATESIEASADEFLAYALQWFGDDDPARGSPRDKGIRLAQLIRKQRSLLILDRLEPLQYPVGEMQGRLKDPGMQALLKELCHTNPGLCVITTRLPVADIEHAVDESLKRIYLGHLSPEAGAKLLGKLGVIGTAADLQEAAREFHGHALTLNLLGRYIVVAHEADIHKRDLFSNSEDDAKKGGHARCVMEAYERWFQAPPADREDAAEISPVPEEEEAKGIFQLFRDLLYIPEKSVCQPGLNILYIMGLFECPADMDAIKAVLRSPAIQGLTEELQDISDKAWEEAIHCLRYLRLLAEEPTPNPPPGRDNAVKLRDGLRKIPPNPPLRKGGTRSFPPFRKGGLGGILTKDHDPSRLNSTVLPAAPLGLVGNGGRSIDFLPTYRSYGAKTRFHEPMTLKSTALGVRG